MDPVITPAMLFGSAGISALGSVGSALIGSSASDKAARHANNRAKEAMRFQQNVYNKTQADFKPFLDEGTSALSRLGEFNDGQGIGGDAEYQSYLRQLNAMAEAPTTTGAEVYDDPIYRFMREESERNLSRKLRSLGRENSTYGFDATGRQGNQLAADQFNNINAINTQRDNTKFGRLSGLASTRYATLADQYQRLRDLANSGQAAAGMTANAGQNFSNSASQTLTNLGNTQANAALAGGAMGAGAIQNFVGNTAGLTNLAMKYNDSLNKNSGNLYGDYQPADTSFLEYKPSY